MVAVTQRIPNYLGGVSQQTDDLKLPGQVSICDNTYPEPTFGLLKRPGGLFTGQLTDDQDVPIASNSFQNSKWFSIFTDTDTPYVGVISQIEVDNEPQGEIKLWNLTTGDPVTVTIAGEGELYLDGSPDDFDIFSINDTTFITNKSVTVAALEDDVYTYGTNATIRLRDIEYGATYRVTINDVTVQYTTQNAEPVVEAPAQVEATVNAKVILEALEPLIEAQPNIDAQIIGSTIEVTSTNNTAFTISVSGGSTGEAITVYQDTVDNISKLASTTVDGRIVEVTNTNNTSSNYYVKFVATNGNEGAGYWEETLNPTISPGLDSLTMPHQLVKQLDGTFEFSPVIWEPRLVGDNLTNSHPSFVGNTIQKVFFYNNRLGVLTEDNVSLSQAGDYYNFYHTSALTVTAADPVDISCSSIKPARLHGVIPVAQGLLLFSRSQQFLMQGSGGVLTPSSSNIKTISNYEVEPGINPVDMGTTICFVSKTPSYTRVFEMQTRGQDESPVVIDISRIVPEWIPSSIKDVVSSPQNNLLSLADPASNTLYIFRFYTNGDTREIQSWFRWKLPGPIVHHAIDRDVVWAVTRQSNSFYIQKISLIQSPSTSTFITSDGSKVDPRLDCWSVSQATFINEDPADTYSRIDLPFIPDPNLILTVVTLTPEGEELNFSNSGLVLYPTTTVLDEAENTHYAKINDIDLSGSTVVVGYSYEMLVEIPQNYFRSGDRQQVTDWSASLIIARIKMLLGLGGDVVFKLTSKGRDEWVDTEGVKAADYYLADDTPFTKSAEFTIPIHQKSDNYTMQIYSTTPFPVSLLSMKWEGNYSPRFYRRS